MTKEANDEQQIGIPSQEDINGFTAEHKGRSMITDDKAGSSTTENGENPAR